ncbi:MAG: hypothetical protein S4CHLAM45_08670 [Chlamydiales bacterium]|nr:hypothetical protein [Chlamydiales bacterium]MCH9620383.1 hypothetical protein [Chlamydiales bacterium]MCH9622971.1 hypothetical protein [Chlamydiales bacterium]
MFLKLTILFLLLVDPVGNVPFFVSVLKHVDPKRQKFIILRELVIALLIMIFFLFFGEIFFRVINITQNTLEITGGIILFIIALDMLFSKPLLAVEKKKVYKEPLIVPLAIPATAGPAILAVIVLYGGKEVSKGLLLLVILLTWLISVPILLLAPTIKRLLGDNGAVAVERIFGYIVVLLSVQMVAHGLLS